jgi:hypothetical protein
MEAPVAAKRLGGEGDDFAPPAPAAGFVSRELERLEKSPPTLASGQEKAGLDELFRAALAEAWPCHFNRYCGNNLKLT